jgi:hypothetical protein
VRHTFQSGVDWLTVCRKLSRIRSWTHSGRMIDLGGSKTYVFRVFEVRLITRRSPERGVYTDAGSIAFS